MRIIFVNLSQLFFAKGPFKYYVSKEVGGSGGQLLMFADKVGGWGWPNFFFGHRKKVNFFPNLALLIRDKKNVMF